MSSPRLLDLFSGAGGAAEGYRRAGFYVVGVDIDEQPRYAGDRFVEMDAMHYAAHVEAIVREYDAVHASPPCQRYIRGGLSDYEKHPDLLCETRTLLEEIGLPYVIENVPGAPMRPDVILCGSMFGLSVRRHRWFESNVPLNPLTLCCDHSRPVVGVYGHPHGEAGAWPGMLPSTREFWSKAMGIDWMEPHELSQAIPPAYTEHIGRQLLSSLGQKKGGNAWEAEEPDVVNQGPSDG